MINKRFLLSATVIILTAKAQAASLGAGTSFAAPTQALVVNPVALLDAPKIAAEGIWRFKTDNAFASVVGGLGPAGVGADFRRENGKNVFEAGAAVNLALLSLGITGRSYDGEMDVDTGIALNLPMMRLSLVARSWDDKIDRLDFGLGVIVGPAVLSADFKKFYPFDDAEKAFLLDFGAVVDVGTVALGAGYDVGHTKSGGWTDGRLHASIAVQVMPDVYAEGFYRPLAQEWQTDDWALGARVLF